MHIKKLFEAADAMYGLLMARADLLVGCTRGSDEEKEYKALRRAMSAYEYERWPKGKIAGGKGGG